MMWRITECSADVLSWGLGSVSGSGVGQVSRELALSVGESRIWSEFEPRSWMLGDPQGSPGTRVRDVWRDPDFGC